MDLATQAEMNLIFDRSFGLVSDPAPKAFVLVRGTTIKPRIKKLKTSYWCQKIKIKEVSSQIKPFVQNG